MRTKIYQDDSWYTVLKSIVDCCTRGSYRRMEVRGKDNIPTDGAVILAPNHTNTLMDALVVLQTHRDQTVFGARADMFNKPFIAKMMYFFRILPMVRQRDGLRNVLKNYESFETIVETLENGVRFCMYPEGRHRAARSLLTFGKGITRAAVAANNRFGNDRPVYIVPVGIEYGDYFRYRSTCLISFGEAINVTEFIRGLNVENEAQIMDPLRQELRNRISGLITFIKDDENLNAKWSLVKILRGGKSFRSLTKRLDLNKEIVSKVENAFEAEPQKMEELAKKAADLNARMRKAGITTRSLGSSCLLGKCLGKTLLALLGLPYFIFSLIASLPMWVAALFIRNKGIKDKAFGNTVSFGVKLGLGAIWYPIVALICFLTAPWFIALPVALLAVPTYNYFYDYTEFCRILFSDMKLFFCRKYEREANDIQSIFSKLV